jgi:hypothetical protein
VTTAEGLAQQQGTLHPIQVISRSTPYVAKRYQSIVIEEASEEIIPKCIFKVNEKTFKFQQSMNFKIRIFNELIFSIKKII